MVLDTGSELSWLYCKQSSTSTTPIFDHAKSSSYIAIPCSSPVCTTQTQDLPAPATCDKQANLCHVAVSYVDGSSLDGNLAKETFGIGSWTRPAMVFGCMDSSSSDAETITGLMGMNRGRLSFINQISLLKFSYCISGSDSTGVLVLGEASLPPLKYSPLVTKTDRLPYWDRFAYTVQFEGIQTILDSGTQFTFLLDPVYSVLKTEFTEQTKSVLTVDPSYVFQTAMDLCFQVGSTKPDFSKLPTVSLMFRGAELTVSGEKLLYQVPGLGSDQKYCFTFGNSDLAGFEVFIIGNVHQQNVWMEYDIANAQVGFANDVRCDQASQLL
ncbi:hypothetical protein Bca52824_007682 [Brassica carinata]|uniref:Peptidase A1 domain-containing protein n=1 Tax=Brassica carinata TaxID=52824 RepID=A0A8X8B5J4_BRACI|nr:hypothetical protein Bca52824_007682 [Brassica carinata]